MRRAAFVFAGLAAGAVPPAHAGDGPFGIDHRVSYDNSGIWKRRWQQDLNNGAIVTVLAGSLWLGGDSELGDTFWRATDAMVLTAGTTEVMKRTFRRERPSKTDDPDRWFKGSGDQSFPSGEVANIAAITTPFMLRYGPEHPAVYALALLPVYDAVARVKVRGHWQSDVIAGAAIGAGVGWYAMRREHPLILAALPHGFFVGFSKRFD